ncbi:MAG TPA: DUF423 domain-containing protein [Bryobacteraceae bacterium]|nr:DUF423 domain-containing protein [Bryobacteraceae bacterium]
MSWPAVGAFGLAIAVMLGAFGAHGLRTRLDAYSLDIWQRAVFYQFMHAFGLLVAPLFRISPRARTWVCWLLLAGIVLFCGSLYALALTGTRVLGAVTPFGGLSFIAAWIVLAIAILRAPK